MKQQLNKNFSLFLKLFLLVVSAFLIALATNFYLVPHNTYPLGLMGLTSEMAHIIGFIPGLDSPILINIITWTTYLILNIPLLLLAYLKINKKFALNTLFVIVCTTIFGLVLPTHPHPLPDINTITNSLGNVKKHHYIPNCLYIKNDLISVIFGAILLGVGLGIILKFRGSTGGTDIIAMYLSKYKNKGFAIYNFLFSSIIVIIAVALSFVPQTSDALPDDSSQMTIAVIMLIMLVVWTKSLNVVHDSYAKITLLVITNHEKEISDWFTGNFDKTTTVLKSMGGLSRKENNTIILTISYLDKKRCVKEIQKIDKNAWISILKNISVEGNFINRDTYN